MKVALHPIEGSLINLDFPGYAAELGGHVGGIGGDQARS
jgi:hypothetical protein